MGSAFIACRAGFIERAHRPVYPREAKQGESCLRVGKAPPLGIEAASTTSYPRLILLWQVSVCRCCPCRQNAEIGVGEPDVVAHALGAALANVGCSVSLVCSSTRLWKIQPRPDLSRSHLRRHPPSRPPSAATPWRTSDPAGSLLDGFLSPFTIRTHN